MFFVEFFVWVLGTVLDAQEVPAGCLDTGMAGVGLCVDGGNSVPYDLTQEYIPVKGTDVSLGIHKKF